MTDAPRLLFVADAAAAIDALAAVRGGGAVQAQLAPTADVLRDTLAAPTAVADWDAVVYLPGGAVEEVELAVFVPDGLRLFVVAEDVPLLLMETAAEALSEGALGELVHRLAAPVAAAPAPVDEDWGLDLAPAEDPAPPASDPVGDAAGPEESAPSGGESALPAEALVSPSAENLFGDARGVPTTSPLPPGEGHGEGGHGSDAARDAPLTLSPSGVERGPLAGSLPGPETSAVEEPTTRAETAYSTGEADPFEETVAALTPPEPDGSETVQVPVDPVEPGSADPDVAPAPEAMSDDLATLAEHLPIGLYRTDPEGHVLYANPALHALLGTDEPLASLDVGADLGYPRAAFQAQIGESGEVRNLIVTWTRPDGKRVHTRENARCLRDADGVVVAYEGTLEDVTDEVEGRLDEQALVREHRAVAAFAAAAALATDPVTIQCAAAGALLDATGATWGALVTRDATGTVEAAATAGDLPGGLLPLLSETRALADRIFPFLSAAPAALSVEADAPDALREVGIGALAAVPVERAGRRYGALIWGGPDRHPSRPTEGHAAEALAWHVGGQLERIAAREALRDTEATLAVVAEHTPHVLYRLRYTAAGPVADYLSPAVEALTGYSRADLAERGGLRTLIDRSESSEGAGLLEGPVAGADRYVAVYRIATAHGPRWVEDTARPWRDGAGRPLGLVGVVSDVTDRRAREQALAHRAEGALARQRALVDLAGLGGADAYGAPAAAIVAATLEAAGVSFWTVGAGTCAPLFSPPRTRLGGSPAHVVPYLADHRALAVDDVTADDRVADFDLAPFVRAYGLTALLVAPVRRKGAVVGLVAIHRTDGPHAWDPSEAEFAGAVADAIALALERDDRDLALAELQEARAVAASGHAEAVRTDRLQTDFMTALGEEVRGPLAGILEHADGLAEAVPSPHRGAAVRIARTGRQLLDTVDAVLDLSRLEAGAASPDLTTQSLAAPVRDAAAPFQGTARGKGLRLDLDLDPEVEAAIDVDALRRLVGRLVENAIAFTDDGGVHVAVEADGQDAVVRVADTGRGMDATFLSEACTPFRQEDPAHRGVGLGLALADRLARRMGGRLDIASERPGGTVVTVAFPLASTPAAAPTASADAPADPGDLLGQPFDFTFLNRPTAPPPAARSLAPTTSAPTDMFDFQFGRPQPADPSASTPPPDAQAPETPPPSAAPTAPPPQEPVLFVRPREAAPPAVARPTIPEAPTAPVEEAEVVSDGRPSVLVVEDNDDTRMLLERILRTTYAVTAVGDARSALLAMNQQRFAGLVLDINLGGKETGADVLRIARSLPDYGGVFAIALTAYALPGDRERLLESGFNAYISKPFTRSSLMETLAGGVNA